MSEISYKAIILDIDGTIIPNYEECEPSEAVLSELKRVQKNAKVIFATGRSATDSDPIINKLYDGTPYIYINGARIEVPLGGKVLGSYALGAVDAERIFEIARESEVYAYTDEGTVLVHDNPQYETDYTIVAPKSLTSSYSLQITNLNDKEFDQVMATLRPDSQYNLGWTHAWNPVFRDITVTHRDATKKHALAFLLKHLGIDPAEVIAIGDGGNDLPLFEGSGLAIAMGNAPDLVKQHAQVIAPSVQEDGVASILRKYFP